MSRYGFGIRTWFARAAEMWPTHEQSGRITLVGAGPGDADLITMRGAQALSNADVVVHDVLSDPSVLDLAPATALRISVGEAQDQTDISDKLVEHAKNGNHVVRLKGGDPFVFGRGAEEIEAASRADIPVDVVPGLSSSTAAATLAQIPLTDQRHSSGFVVISGHRASSDEYDWAAMSSDQLTVVALMAASTAAELSTRLLENGRKAATPVAFIHKAGRTDEAVEVTSLGDVSQTGCTFAAPTVMIVGDVAGRARLSTPPLDSTSQVSDAMREMVPN